MNRLSIPFAVILSAVALLGCGRDRLVGGGNDAPADPGTVSNAPGSTSNALIKTALMIQGTNQADFEHVWIGVRELQVLADGVPLKVEPVGNTIDLGKINQAWTVGQVSVPASTQSLQLRLVVDDGGAFQQAGTGGYLAGAKTTVLQLKPERIGLRNHVVLNLDLARSMVALRGEERVLVPQWVVHY
jgi:hypothetical protein